MNSYHVDVCFRIRVWQEQSPGELGNANAIFLSFRQNELPSDWVNRQFTDIQSELN